jgi:hypothetical protein
MRASDLEELELIGTAIHKPRELEGLIDLGHDSWAVNAVALIAIWRNV